MIMPTFYVLVSRITHLTNVYVMFQGANDEYHNELSEEEDAKVTFAHVQSQSIIATADSGSPSKLGYRSTVSTPSTQPEDDYTQL